MYLENNLIFTKFQKGHCPFKFFLKEGNCFSCSLPQLTLMPTYTQHIETHVFQICLGKNLTSQCV